MYDSSDMIRLVSRVTGLFNSFRLSTVLRITAFSVVSDPRVDLVTFLGSSITFGFAGGNASCFARGCVFTTLARGSNVVGTFGLPS